jgi:23S rRNA A2030 N6-methylase RlmJ
VGDVVTVHGVNPYAANFGDVVKHAVVCEVVRLEQPARYLESHGGALEYPLDGLDPGPGGVWDFLERSRDVAALGSSSYASVISRVVGTREQPGVYPGSIALADALLPPTSEVIAFELVESSAEDLRDGLAARGRRAQVSVADGLAGVCAAARTGDLVLLDPFDVHARGAVHTSPEAFVDLASHGVPVVLWYAIYDPAESAAWIDDVVGGAAGWQARLIGDTAEGGLAGCGLLMANVSDTSCTAATAIVEALAGSLADVRPGLRSARTG